MKGYIMNIQIIKHVFIKLVKGIGFIIFFYALLWICMWIITFILMRYFVV